jgi:hypothetical protein
MPASASSSMTAAIDSGTSVASACTSVERDAVDGDADVDDSSMRSGDRAVSIDAGSSPAARKYAVTIGLTVIGPAAGASNRVCLGWRAIWRKARASAGVA